MVDVNVLKSEIVKNGMSYKEIAQILGISVTTFWRRLKTGNFGLKEAQILIDCLNIKKPEEIFFAKKIT